MKERIHEIPLSKIKIRDDFWSEKQNMIADVVIPFQEKVLNDEVEGVEKSHAFANFRIAAGLEEGEFYGMVFQDSDVAKWLEGVAYSLTVKENPALEERADRIIDTIEKAQQPDGYLNTYFTFKEPEHRWQNLQECHELYCAGHMMEAAAAYYDATGKDKLLKVMERMADHIAARFGPGKETGIPGHQEIEIGLMKLYHATGKVKYRELAQYFLDERGKNPGFFKEEKEKRGWVHFNMDPEDTKYNQSFAPVREQKTAEGHSVRAVYMYTAMADLAGCTGEEALLQACDTLWDNITQKRMYLTGGIGSTGEGEAFSIDYDLPNDMAYAETCTSIGMAFFAREMLKRKPSNKYADILERELYNGILSGMQLDGKRFFYVNPLEVNPGVSGVIHGYKHVVPQRPGWYACACCPPNLVRLVMSLGKYAWSASESTLYSHLYVGGSVEWEKATVEAESCFPWKGEVSYTVHPCREGERFGLAVRIPSYIKERTVRLNGVEIECSGALGTEAENGVAGWAGAGSAGSEAVMEPGSIQPGSKASGQADSIEERDGYLFIDREWQEGDRLEITFPMPVRKVYCSSAVRENENCVAIMRGPVVYCFEGADNGDRIQEIRIPGEMDMEGHVEEEGILKGMVLLEGKAQRQPAAEQLYMEELPPCVPARVKAIPYYAWGNRGLNQMRVWMPRG